MNLSIILINIFIFKRYRKWKVWLSQLGVDPTAYQFIYIVQSVYNIPFLYNTRTYTKKNKIKRAAVWKDPKRKTGNTHTHTHTIRYGDGKGKRRRWQELCLKASSIKKKKDSRGAIFDKSGVGHVAPTVQPHQVSGGSPAFFSIERGEKISSAVSSSSFFLLLPHHLLKLSFL